MLSAIGGWVIAGVIGGVWSSRKERGVAEGLDGLTDTHYGTGRGPGNLGGAGVSRDPSLTTGMEETSPVFIAALLGPVALYRAWKQPQGR